MGTMAGLGIGTGVVLAGYGLSRVLSNQGKMTPMDFYKHYKGAYASAVDAWNAVKDGSQGVAAKANAWQKMEQAGQSLAEYGSMLGPDKQAEVRQLNSEFGQVLPDWYSKYLSTVPKGGRPL
jgi:hypothetical protein